MSAHLKLRIGWDEEERVWRVGLGFLGNVGGILGQKD